MNNVVKSLKEFARRPVSKDFALAQKSHFLLEWLQKGEAAFPNLSKNKNL